MKVLFVASEVSPIIKLGGLGDVIGSLPKALENLGCFVDVAVPFYPIANIKNVKIFKRTEIYVPFGGKEHMITVYMTKLPSSNVRVFLFKNDDFFAPGGQNAFANSLSEAEMFSFFDRAVVEYVKTSFNTYDVIHCHDWHTGLITHLLQEELGNERPATVLTIHNLSYQGKGDASILKDLGLVPGTHPVIDWDINDGDLNLLEQGIVSADYINAVSPSYADEILTKKLGGELSSILKARKARLCGILNGLDYNQFPRNFDKSTYFEKKPIAKKQILQKLKLDADPHRPLFSFISRLDPNQKGLDILYESIPKIVKKGGQFILLSVGDPVWEEKFEKLSKRKTLAGMISVNIKFDVDLALEIYAGSDFFLMPSRFEPCGLTQMISMWYGTIPIVHNVGGLKDSVQDEKNGFVFKTHTSASLMKSVTRAFKVYGTEEHKTMIAKAFDAKFAWDSSAKKYIEIYKKAIDLQEDSFSESEIV